MSPAWTSLRQNGIRATLRTLLVWKLWRPWQRRRWMARCRRQELAVPLDLSERGWAWAAPGDMPLDWFSPDFPLDKEGLARLATDSGLLAAREALRERCASIERGDFRWLMANTPVLGPLPDWHALLDQPGSWPYFASRDIDYMSEARPGDIRRIWELNRHQYFVVLGRAWRLDGNPRWAECFVSHLEDWIRRNPPGRGPHWIQAQEVALRAISWCWAWHLFHDAPAFTEELRRSMLKALSWHLRFLEREVCAFGKWTHNHLISELAGIHVVSILFPQFRDGDRLADWSRRLLLREVEKQVWPDGMAGELATAYMSFVLETLTGVLACRRDSWRGTILEQRLVAMGRASAWLLRPDGSLPLVGDSDSGRGWLQSEHADSTGGREALAQLPMILAGEAPAPWIPHAPAPEWGWLFASGRQAGIRGPVEPPGRTRLFREAGIWCWREDDSPGSSWLLFRGGAVKRRRWVQQSHHHADILSFEYAHAGHPLFVDPGTYAYGLETELRQALRSSRAHNVLWVEGLEPCDFREQRFGVWNLPLSRYLKSPGTETGIAMGFTSGPVVHDRHLRPTTGGFQLEDRILRPAGLRAGLGFQLAPGVQVMTMPRGWIFPDLGLELRLTAPLDLSHELKIEEGRVSRRYGESVTAPRLRLWLPARAECRISLELRPAT